MGAETTIRDSLNSSDPDRLDAAFRLTGGLGLGELLSVLIDGATPTESGATITSHVCTMAAAASAIYRVKGIAGTSGVKKLLIGTGITPNPGEVVWDGGVKLTFNAADANTTCDLTYAKADGSQKSSMLLRSIGEIDK